MCLKHQITSFPNNGLNREVRKREKHWHSSVIFYVVQLMRHYVWEYTSLEKWRASFSHSLSLSLRLLSLTQTHSQYDRWSWSLDNAGTSEFVMNTSSILMAWESPERCQAPLKRNMDFHFKRALLRTKSGRREGQTRPPHTWQGPTWAAVQRPFTVSDSNRGVHLRTSVAASASSASWQVADLRSCVMIRIKVRAKQHEEIHKRYLAF